jgi:hypothetical protein
MIRDTFAALLFGVSAFAGFAYAESISFEREAIGIPPRDFDFWGTGEAGPGEWAVVQDDNARGGHALEQYRREPTEDRVPLAIYKPFSGANVEVELRFKPIAGSLDQSGGIVVRLVTPDDYYVARASAFAQKVGFYRVVKGDWDQLASATTRVTPNEWHVIALKAEGDRFDVRFDGQQLLSVIDATMNGPARSRYGREPIASRASIIWKSSRYVRGS